MNVHPKVAIVYHKTVFNNYRSFPKILHEHSVVHVVRNATILQLYGHWEFLEEKDGIWDQICRLFRTSYKNSTTLVALYGAPIHNKTRIKQAYSKAIFRIFKLAIFNLEYILFVRLVVNTMKFAIICLVLLEFVSVYLYISQGQILHQQAFFFIPVDKVLRKVYLQIVCRVFVPLNFNPTIVILAKIILDYLDHA